MTTHRLEETAQVLIGAYLRGELKHGNRCECAVGNLIAGKNPDLTWNQRDFAWSVDCIYNQVFLKDWVLNRPPYSGFELGRIEKAFEARSFTFCHLNNDDDPDSFIGLTNVFDLLCNELDKDYFEVGDVLEIEV